MFLIFCNSSFTLIGHEDDKCIELIIKLFNLPDDTAMTVVNDYIMKNGYPNQEPWTCTWLPTASTLFLVLRRVRRSITRLICSKWGIDDNIIEDIVSRLCNESDVWKILLDRFSTEITDEMKFKILQCCVKGRHGSDKIFRAVLRTDKQRTDEDVCTLLSAYEGSVVRDDCVTPLLQTYHNLPLQDVLRVMNHLLTDKDRLEVVYKIMVVYSEYHDVYRAMIDEMQSNPGFNKHASDYHSSKSVMAEVVKKYTDIYARNTSSSHDSMKSESVME